LMGMASILGWNGSSLVFPDLTINNHVGVVYETSAMDSYNGFIAFLTDGMWYDVTTSGQVAITNPGNADTGVVVTFAKGIPAGSAPPACELSDDYVNVRYLSSQEIDPIIWLDYDMFMADNLVIDTRLGQIPIRSTSFGNKVQGNPLPGSQLTRFMLKKGVNHVNALAVMLAWASAVCNEATATLSYRPAYWGID